MSVLNGADGLSDIAAGLVGQGLTILESVKKSLSGSVGSEVKLFDNGAAPGLTVTNTAVGTISGTSFATGFGINAATATVTNFGTISGASFNNIGFGPDGAPSPSDLHQAWAHGARAYLLSPR